MFMQQKLSYKCIQHGFKMSFMMTNIEAHTTGNSNVQSMWLVIALWKVKHCPNGKVLAKYLICEICHICYHDIRNVITIYYAIDLRNEVWIFHVLYIHTNWKCGFCMCQINIKCVDGNIPNCVFAYIKCSYHQWRYWVTEIVCRMKLCWNVISRNEYCMTSRILSLFL